MVLIPVRCPHCDSDKVVKRGKTDTGKQRYLSQNDECPNRTFILDYSYRAYLPEVRQQIIDMAMNGSGVRDTGRVLGISKDTVLSALKKKEDDIQFANIALLKALNPADVTVVIHKIDETEVDEMWSYVGDKKQQRWL